MKGERYKGNMEKGDRKKMKQREKRRERNLKIGREGESERDRE